MSSPFEREEYAKEFYTKHVLPKVIPEGDLGNDMLGFTVRSHTDLLKRYPVWINTVTGECSCACMHFQCRLRRYWPSVLEACKHIVEDIYGAAIDAEGDNEHE